MGVSKAHHRFWLRRIWDVAKERVVLSALHVGLAVTYHTLQFVFNPNSSSGRGETRREQDMHRSWEVLNNARAFPRAAPTSPSLPLCLPCTSPKGMGLSKGDRRWGEARTWEKPICSQPGFTM